MLLRELRRHVGRLAVVGFAGQGVPAELRQLVADFDLGGVIYFARNVVEPRQVAELSREVAALAVDWPLWVSVDQEGGRVARLKRPFTEWPPAMTLGRSGSERLAERFAAALAAELAAVGINLDYAPVLDVHTNPANPVIGDRALAEGAELAARLGRAVIRGLQQGGVAACGKHFPGHGDTSRDSHEELPIVEHDRRRLDAVELVPFRAAIDAGVGTLMTAHVLVPALDDRPASLSSTIVTGLLKHTLGFEGLVLSDDLGMKAISASWPLPDATIAAIAAGCDAVLFCNHTVDDQVAALEAVIRAAESGRLSPERLDDALARQERVKSRFLTPARPRLGLEVVGCAEHQAVAEEMAAFR
ncbi:MAG: beta-N-acetylhexosaminidase [Vicinamibacterales bacterium]